MAEDVYMPGRHPGEPIEDYQARTALEAEQRGVSVEEYKDSLMSDQARAAQSE